MLYTIRNVIGDIAEQSPFNTLDFYLTDEQEDIIKSYWGEQGLYILRGRTGWECADIIKRIVLLINEPARISKKDWKRVEIKTKYTLLDLLKFVYIEPDKIIRVFQGACLQ
jgi:hypothetical protein